MPLTEENIIFKTYLDYTTCDFRINTQNNTCIVAKRTHKSTPIGTRVRACITKLLINIFQLSFLIILIWLRLTKRCHRNAISLKQDSFTCFSQFNPFKRIAFQRTPTKSLTKWEGGKQY